MAGATSTQGLHVPGGALGVAGHVPRDVGPGFSVAQAGFGSMWDCDFRGTQIARLDPVAALAEIGPCRMSVGVRRVGLWASPNG
jgi:hypothetical protein